MVLLLAQSSFYGYFSMKGRPSKESYILIYLFFLYFDILKACINKPSLILKSWFAPPFTKPIKELKTRNLDQVEDLLREVEAYQEQGFYAVGYVSYEAALLLRRSLLSIQHLLWESISSFYDPRGGRNPSFPRAL